MGATTHSALGGGEEGVVAEAQRGVRPRHVGHGLGLQRGQRQPTPSARVPVTYNLLPTSGVGGGEVHFPLFFLATQLFFFGHQITSDPGGRRPLPKIEPLFNLGCWAPGGGQAATLLVLLFIF